MSEILFVRCRLKAEDDSAFVELDLMIDEKLNCIPGKVYFGYWEEIETRDGYPFRLTSSSKNTDFGIYREWYGEERFGHFDVYEKGLHLGSVISYVEENYQVLFIVEERTEISSGKRWQ